MPVPSYELTRLDANTFEHLANTLAMRALGSGHTGFGPRADGGRDGLFEGQAPYPSEKENWSGLWYVQSKFHAPHISTDAQKWLLARIREEITAFTKPDTDRRWPNNWIIVTNVDPSGKPNTGVFDAAREMVRQVNPELADKFHIWGGRKVLDLLALNPEIGAYYSEFLTSGQVLSSIFNSINDSSANTKEILRYLIATQFADHQYTKLDQAGSKHDNRPGIHSLFQDLPFKHSGIRWVEPAAAVFTKAAAQNHSIPLDHTNPDWSRWRNVPSRARIWFLKGGPGQGKSTLTQYISQVHRASLLLAEGAPIVNETVKILARRVEDIAKRGNHWPLAARIPVAIELRQFAHWYGRVPADASKTILSYMSETIAKNISQPVQVGTLKRSLEKSKWLFVFDGLDEVPADVKDEVADAIRYFVDDVLIGCRCDAISICTSRPQGYSGQFDQLEAATIELAPLEPAEALACAKPVLEIDRSIEDSTIDYQILMQAVESPAIQEIMTTPLQSHIMAVVVRGGNHPPERKWALFSNFYNVIKKREASKNHADQRISKILQEDKLLKTLHNRLGFELHSRAEKSEGAQTSLSRSEFEAIVRETVKSLQDKSVEDTVSTLMEATTERLVLVSTPDNGSAIRFDIRPLQEFFAAEYLYETADFRTIDKRIRTIGADSHWREVMHFFFSALVENERHAELAIAVECLLEIDEGPAGENRNLSRRLAVGGVITSRLLREGVLEADKRIRQQFRKCLMALLGSVKADNYLPPWSGAHSTEWFTDVVIDTVLEQSGQENIGAARVAFSIVPDNHPRLAALVERLSNSSIDYRSALFENVHIQRKTSTWVAKFAIAQMLLNDWYKLSKEAIAAIELIISNNEIDRKILFGLIPDTLHNFLFDVFSEHPPETPGKTYRHYGFIELYPQKIPESFAAHNLSNENWRNLDASSGILHVAGLVLGTAYDRADAKSELSALIKEHPEIPYKLPGTIQVFFNKLHWGINDSIENIVPSKYGIIMSPSITISGGTGKRIGKKDFVNFLNEMPILMLMLINDIAFRREIKDILKFISTTEGSNILFDRLSSTAEARSSILPYLGTTQPGLLNVFERLRREPTYATQSVLFRPAMHPAPLRLPEEEQALPVIVSMAYAYYAQARQLGMKREFLPTLSGYCDDAGALMKVYKKSNDAFIRAAAFIFLANSEYGRNNNILIMNNVLPLYKECRETWFGYALFDLASEGVKRGNADHIQMIDRLIEEAREDFRVRTAVEPLIERWREFSRSPVSTSDAAIWKAREEF